MRKIDMNTHDLNMVLEILDAHAPGYEVWVFGSRAAGRAKEFSDLDLAIIGEEPLSATTLADLKDSFTESDLPFKVDIVDWAGTSQSFRKIIKGQHVVLRKPVSSEISAKKNE